MNQASSALTSPELSLLKRVTPRSRMKPANMGYPVGWELLGMLFPRSLARRRLAWRGRLVRGGRGVRLRLGLWARLLLRAGLALRLRTSLFLRAGLVLRLSCRTGSTVGLAARIEAGSRSTGGDALSLRDGVDVSRKLLRGAGRGHLRMSAIDTG